MSSITVDVHAPGGKKAGKAELPGETWEIAFAFCVAEHIS